MTAPLAVRLGADQADLIDLSADVRRAIAEEAALRRLSPRGLVAQLLEAIVAGDQFDAVLRRGSAR